MSKLIELALDGVNKQVSLILTNEKEGNWWDADQRQKAIGIAIALTEALKQALEAIL